MAFPSAPWVCFCLLLLALQLPPYTSASVSASSVVTVDVHEAKGLLGSGHRYLDVRTAEEFLKGHVDGAINVPYLFFTSEGKVKNTEFLKQVSLVCNKEDRVVVGCQSGVRSHAATTDLVHAGYKHVKNMGGGYAAWLENGFIVKKPREGDF